MMGRADRLRQKIVPSSTHASTRMRANRSRDTTPELLLRSELHRRGLRFRVHLGLIPGVRRRVDLVFKSARVAVFIDGCFWHGCPRHGTWPKANAAFWRNKIEANRARDRNTDALLRAEGWRVMRVWEHEDPRLAAERIELAVRRRLGRPS